MFYSRFESQCKMCKKSPTAVCVELGFSNATASHWKNGHLPKADILITIADYFDCSVDYLLGRTDTPEIGGVHQEITAGRDNYVNSTVNNGFSNDDIGLLHLIQNIPLIERSKLIFELSEKYSVER